MPDPVIAEVATVYRGGGRRWFTHKAALKAYANAKFRAKHRCECEQGDYSSGYPGYTCGIHVVYDKVMPRYMRLLKKAITVNRHA
jgi:hypothetical protein